jgi:hypothetical protein
MLHKTQHTRLQRIQYFALANLIIYTVVEAGNNAGTVAKIYKHQWEQQVRVQLLH